MSHTNVYACNGVHPNVLLSYLSPGLALMLLWNGRGSHDQRRFQGKDPPVRRECLTLGRVFCFILLSLVDKVLEPVVTGVLLVPAHAGGVCVCAELLTRCFGPVGRGSWWQHDPPVEHSVPAEEVRHTHLLAGHPLQGHGGEDDAQLQC